MVVLGRGQVQLREDAGDVLLHGPLGDDERLGDAVVGTALRHVTEDLSLARAECRQRVLPPTAPDEARDDFGIECRAAFPDPTHAVNEAVDVRDAVLQQIADALRVVGQQLERVGLLDVLGEHEHARLRLLGPDGRGRTQTLVGLRRRHADVDQRDVGLVCADLAQQVLRVSGLADDVHAGLLQQAYDALTQQDAVLGYDDSHGILARTVVPSPGGLTTSRRPSRPASLSARPLSPLPASNDAPPHPSSWTSTSAMPFCLATRTVACDAPACLAMFARDSATTKYSAASTAVGSRASGVDSTRTGIENREARPAIAAPSPRSVSTAGWMPRASSRSSSRARRSSSRARSRMAPAASGSLVSFARATCTCSDRATRRCWAPSCRSRSRRRRSARPVSMSRARDSLRSSSRARSSASRRWLAIASAAAAATALKSSGSSQRLRSCTSAPMRSPSRSTMVAARAGSASPGIATVRPVPSTKRSGSGSQ